MKRFVSIRLALLLTAPSVFGGVMLFPAPPPPGVIVSPHYRLEVRTPAGCTLHSSPMSSPPVLLPPTGLRVIH